MNTVILDGHELIPVVAWYNKPRNIAVSLTFQNGAPYARASMNPEVVLPEGTVAIKSWSENVGVQEALTEAGLLGKVVMRIQSGYISVPVFEWLGDKP